MTGPLLVIQVLARVLDEPSHSKTIAIGCTLILTLAHSIPQMLGRKFATNGPRSLEHWLGFYGAYFAMMLVGQMPSAEATIGQAALGWMVAPLIIALIGGMEVARHVKALRRHPRALRAFARQYLIVASVIMVLVGLIAIGAGFTWAQWMWGTFVYGGAVAAAGGITHWNRMSQMSVLRIVALALANAFSFVAASTILIYVMRLGEISVDEAVPLLIGGAIGAFFPFVIMALIRRRRALGKA